MIWNWLGIEVSSLWIERRNQCKSSKSGWSRSMIMPTSISRPGKLKGSVDDSRLASLCVLLPLELELKQVQRHSHLKAHSADDKGWSHAKAVELGNSGWYILHRHYLCCRYFLIQLFSPLSSIIFAQLLVSLYCCGDRVIDLHGNQMEVIVGWILIRVLRIFV